MPDMPFYAALPLGSNSEEESIESDELHRVVARARMIALIAAHPPTDECPDPECYICGARDCPFHEELHYHHDGCPACSQALDSIVEILVKNLPVANKVANDLVYKTAGDIFTALVSKGWLHA